MRRQIAASVGGNNLCHCIHFKELLERAQKIEAVEDPESFWRAALGIEQPPMRSTDDAGAQPAYKNPWHSGRDAGGDPGQPGGAGHHGGGGGGQQPAACGRRKTLPRKLVGPLVAIAYKDRPMVDDKTTSQAEFCFNGTKGGAAWKI